VTRDLCIKEEPTSLFLKMWKESNDIEIGFVLLTTTLGEVYGTNIHLRHGHHNTVLYPIIPGHVAVGTFIRCVETSAIRRNLPLHF